MIQFARLKEETNVNNVQLEAGQPLVDFKDNKLYIGKNDGTKMSFYDSGKVDESINSLQSSTDQKLSEIQTSVENKKIYLHHLKGNNIYAGLDIYLDFYSSSSIPIKTYTALESVLGKNFTHSIYGYYDWNGGSASGKPIKVYFMISGGTLYSIYQSESLGNFIINSDSYKNYFDSIIDVVTEI